MLEPVKQIERAVNEKDKFVVSFPQPLQSGISESVFRLQEGQKGVYTVKKIANTEQTGSSF